MTQPMSDLSQRLTETLGLADPPIAIRFSADVPDGVDRFDDPVPAPTDDGRTGRVPAGCAFWGRATERTFATVPEDHGNCSVGSFTHGLVTLDQAASGADVAALLEAGWVTEEAFGGLPAVSGSPGAITYGPLASCEEEPDVVLLHVNGVQAMMLSDALPDLAFEGKPQCHIVPMARESGQVAVSVGCMLSRVRTGMKASEMTCAIPGRGLRVVAGALETSRAADEAVARYAADDKRRFTGRD